jgi:rubrerythrin
MRDMCFRQSGKSSSNEETVMHYDTMETFGQIENEEQVMMEKLRALDEAYQGGNSYPECPRCEGERMVEVIVKLNGSFASPTTESFNCPLCSATGEADAERAEEWLLNIIEEHELSDEDQNYIDDRKKIG